MNPNLPNPFEYYFKELNTGGSGRQHQKKMHDKQVKTNR